MSLPYLNKGRTIGVPTATNPGAGKEGLILDPLDTPKPRANPSAGKTGLVMGGEPGGSQGPTSNQGLGLQMGK